MPAQPSRPSSLATAAPQKKAPISSHSLLHSQQNSIQNAVQSSASSTASLLGSHTSMANSALNQQIAANVAGVFGGSGISTSMAVDGTGVSQQSDLLQTLNSLGTALGQ